MNKNEKSILYIGGFQLPDKNAAAMRVTANAKALRDLGYNVIFVNALTDGGTKAGEWVSYGGFLCFEYRRQSRTKYLLSCKRIKGLIKQLGVAAVIAYNYPALALDGIRRFCAKNSVRCYADATEWYVPKGNIIFRVAKGLDTEIRMRLVTARLDGVIAISRYLYDYYHSRVKTVMIPPLVDVEGLPAPVKNNSSLVELIYAGSPTAQKERLDLIAQACAENPHVRLNICGITREDYVKMYKKGIQADNIHFYGMLPHDETVRLVGQADWAVVVREQNKVVQAGFPTKVVEAVSCKTAVIANRFSNIADYLNRDNSILADSEQEVADIIRSIQKPAFEVRATVFDYRAYLDEFTRLLR